MRSIKKIHSATYSPIADLITWSPLPSRQLQHLDPFLFLNHHGHQVYKPNNRGLPFGPHPHRGMETVTFILEGDIMHKDSGGHESVIGAGGVQWMTAGRGLIHAEVSSDHFKKVGGPLEILQLWVNLPASRKMTEPFYQGLPQTEIPSIALADGNVMLNLISGEWQGQTGAFQPQTPVFLSTLYFKANSQFVADVPQTHNILFYLIKGSLQVNEKAVAVHQLVEFAHDATALHIQAPEDSVLLFGHAQPFHEPIVAQGPFVMNTEQEIYQAYQDYQQGKFGKWTS